jgi:hypothetical protein
MALLGTCRIHGNMEMGERVATQILELEPENATAYMMLLNIYVVLLATSIVAVHCQQTVHPLYSSIFFGASSPKAGGSVGLVAGTISALYRATLQLLRHMTICFGTIHPNTLPSMCSFAKVCTHPLPYIFFLHHCVLQFSQCF